jgi:hypothetical protein
VIAGEFLDQPRYAGELIARDASGNNQDPMVRAMIIEKLDS